MSTDFEMAIDTVANTASPSILVKGVDSIQDNVGTEKFKNQDFVMITYIKKIQKMVIFPTIFLVFFFFEFTRCLKLFYGLYNGYTRVVDFTDYKLETYIKNNADFPPKIFSTSTIRTTNN